MARRRLVPIVLLAAVLLAGCSDDDPAEPAASGSGSTAEEPSSSSSTSSTTQASGTTGSTTATTGAGEDGGISLQGPDGSGSFTYSLSPETSEFCYRMRVEGIGRPDAAQLRRTSGEVVLALRAPTEASIDTCVATDALLIQELQTQPSNFTVEVTGSEGTLTATLR